MANFNDGLLDPFNRIHPGELISGYSDWILFTLLLFFFWSVSGLALKKHFEDSRHLRFLVTSLALMLAVGTYFSIYRGWLHLSLESLGLFGAVLILIAVFFVVYGLIRAYGVQKASAFHFGYALLFISMWSVSPAIFNTLAKVFPLANLILTILFFVSVFNIAMAFFRHSKHGLKDTANRFKELHPAEGRLIHEEMEETRNERKEIKKKALPLTKKEIRSVTHLEESLKKLIDIIRDKGNSLSSEDIIHISEFLKSMAQYELILDKGLNLI